VRLYHDLSAICAIALTFPTAEFIADDCGLLQNKDALSGNIRVEIAFSAGYPRY
jgi:hypothetical protein